MRQSVLGIIRRKPIFKEEKLRVTSHNGRSGKHGSYNPKHNDRQFDVSKSEHIDEVRAMENVYWDYQRGYRFPQEGNDGISFEEIELQFYEEKYGEYVANQNARNEMNRHSERNRSIEDLYRNDKTCPEETIYQIGNMDMSVSAETLLQIAEEFLEERKQMFGSHVEILDFALHVDEATPHIHERHVFHCKNKYGELCPQQEKALEELGVLLPNPDKPKGRKNNRKMTYDATCRQMFLSICKKHGLSVEEEAIYGGQKYLEKNDYIIEKQKKELATQKEAITVLRKKVEVLEEKTNEADELIEELCDITYDVIFDEVASDVVSQTQQECSEEIHFGFNELMDAGFPTNIRSHVWEVFNKIFEVVRKPVEAIVEQVRYDFKRSFTEYYQKERIQEKIWEHIENKAEQDVKQGQEESLVSQLVRRRRGR